MNLFGDVRGPWPPWPDPQPPSTDQPDSDIDSPIQTPPVEVAGLFLTAAIVLTGLWLLSKKTVRAHLKIA